MPTITRCLRGLLIRSALQDRLLASGAIPIDAKQPIEQGADDTLPHPAAAGASVVRQVALH
jgi:hypothetical protein